MPVQRRDFRYDYFIIWSTALQYREEIIEMIKTDAKFEIVECFDHRPQNLHGFISDLYVYDSLPKERLDRKVARVAAGGPEMTILFIKHYDPDLNAVPSNHVEGAMIWKSRYFNGFKDSVRRRFVPGDNIWAVNIIHASDNEEQVDHLLRLLDRKDGIAHLYDKYGKPDPVPGTFGNSKFVPPPEVAARVRQNQSRTGVQQ